MGWKMKNVIALFVVLALIYWQQPAFADMADRTNIEMNVDKDDGRKTVDFLEGDGLKIFDLIREMSKELPWLAPCLNHFEES